MFRFSLSYFLWTLVMLLLEICIATVWQHIHFVRAFLGDTIVVVFLYTLVLSFFSVSRKELLALGVFLFACFIEILQYVNIVKILGISPHGILGIMIGNTFSWWDILSYAGGYVICLTLVMLHKKNSPK